MMERTGNSKFKIPKMPIPDLAKGNVGTDHEGNWTWRHLDNTQHSWRTDPDELKQVPVNTEPVTGENPLVVDIYDSVRSPYSYLVVPRLAWLRMNYNVDVNIHVIFPIAIRTPELAGSSQKVTISGDDVAPKGGRWYFEGYMWNDTKLEAEYQGVPYKFADPDAVIQNFWPMGPEQNP